MKSNLYDLPADFSEQEIFTDLLINHNVRIERIVSYGQTTPTDQPYVQPDDEWVMVLMGKAILKLEDERHVLNAGESLLIPANVKHWITYTQSPTIWLAIHTVGQDRCMTF